MCRRSPQFLLGPLVLLIIAVGELPAQNIGINASGASPHASALLDIDASAVPGSKKGLLIPRVTSAERTSIAAPATSLLVFDTTLDAFYYWDGTMWVPLLSGSTGWALLGNAGTTAANFLGTTDNQSLRFRVNNQPAGFIDRSQFTDNLSLGIMAGALSTGQDNTYLGGSCGQANTTGSENTFVGTEAGYANVAGSFNTYLGWAAAYQSTGGNYNTGVGAVAGNFLTTGSENALFGWSAGSNITTGSQNTMLGNATTTLNGAINSTAIGYRAYAGQSNSMVLGSIAGVNGASSSVNVGIGTSAPADRLHVVGNIRMVDGNQATNHVLVSNANGTGSWQALSPAQTNAWGLNGNAGTSAFNFLGTTDLSPLRIRVANQFAGLIDWSTSSGNVFLGILAGASSSNTQYNTFIGGEAGTSNTTGTANTFVGSAAGLWNSTGHENAGLGHFALYLTTSGSYNTGVGRYAGVSATTGSDNAFLGNTSGIGLMTGDGNTLLGAYTGVFNDDAMNSTALGYRAFVSQNNSLVLGSIAGVNGASASVNVGIGTSAPADRLHVVGSIRMEDGNQAANRVLVSNANGTGSWQTLTPALTNAWGLGGNTITGTEYIGTNNAQPFRFATAGIERMRINAAGDIVAGGTTTPFAVDVFSAVSTGALTYPINGYAYSTGAGVYGDTRPGHSGSAAGVEGISYSNGSGIFYSPGVRGLYLGNTASNAAAGVYGAAAAPASVAHGTAGVHGYNMTTIGTGRMGVLGTYNPAAYGMGVYGIGFGGGIIVGATDVGVCGDVSAAFAYAGYFNGNHAVTGTKAASVPTTQGNQLLYCMESPEIWFEDIGSGALVNGQATITLDPLFLETIDVDADHPLHVFVQVEGECKGVFVEKGADAFTVQELNGGTSNVAFSYRVMAKRKHYADHRFGHDPVFGAADSNPYFSDVEPTPIDPAEHTTWRDRLRREWKQPPVPPGFITQQQLKEQGAGSVFTKPQ